jgi:hypothetical protein
MKNTFFLSLPAAALLFCSCGTVSELAATSGPVAASYSKVVVKDFNYKGASDEPSGPASATTFPEYISTELRKNGSFASVSRTNKPAAGTLVISGDVTRFVSGNAALRLIVGMGAGSSYFDADVHFTDGSTGKQIGSMKVDKNSWVLGGGLAAGQTPDSIMQGAARNVAKEAAKLSLKTQN